MQDPQSLHKYAYAHGDPIGFVDPSGLVASLFGTSAFGIAVEKEIRRIYILDHSGQNTFRSGRATKIGVRPPMGTLGSLYYAKPDLLNKTTKKFAEIKPLSVSGIAAGEAQLLLRAVQFSGTGYSRDSDWRPSVHTGVAMGERFIFVNVNGLVLYSDAIDLAQDVLAISSVALARNFITKELIVRLVARAPQIGLTANTARSAQFSNQLGIASFFAALGVL